MDQSLGRCDHSRTRCVGGSRLSAWCDTRNSCRTLWPVDVAMVDRVRLLLDRIAPTHRDAARQLGLDPTKLSKSLNGVRQFTLAEVTRIADLGHVDVRWLLDGQGPGPLEESESRLSDPKDEARRQQFLEAA